jgi:hypothetical protein
MSFTATSEANSDEIYKGYKVTTVVGWSASTYVGAVTNSYAAGVMNSYTPLYVANYVGVYNANVLGTYYQYIQGSKYEYVIGTVYKYATNEEKVQPMLTSLINLELKQKAEDEALTTKTKNTTTIETTCTRIIGALHSITSGEGISLTATDGVITSSCPAGGIINDALTLSYTASAAIEIAGPVIEISGDEVTIASPMIMLG